MKTWLVILIGAVVGSLVGFLMASTNQDWEHWWIIYPAVACINYLSRVFFPDQDMAGIVFIFPVLVLYFAVIGIAIALATRFVWRKFSA
jgi:hypothetical protein